MIWLWRILGVLIVLAGIWFYCNFHIHRTERYKSFKKQLRSALTDIVGFLIVALGIWVFRGFRL